MKKQNVGFICAYHCSGFIKLSFLWLE